MSAPQQKCTVCGRIEVVTPDGRGYPPDIAARKLAKLCKADGHKATIEYTAGWHLARMATADGATADNVELRA